ncbi:MAG: hypothetical protein Q4C70_12980 [Planctomycetia bacterium]|nr:hypothetical protein [Planctomycetia bacterium]
MVKKSLIRKSSLLSLVAGIAFSGEFMFPGGIGVSCLAESIPSLNPEHPMRLPTVLEGRMMPLEFGCWFPREWEAVEPEGYKPMLDAVGNLAGFDMLAVSSRHTEFESDSPEAIRFQEDAARYASEKYGIRILPDAEIRLARKAFHEAHPDKSLWRIRFTEIEQKAGETASVVLNDGELADHYSHNYRYHVLGVRPIRVWSYTRTADGLVDPATVKDVTAEAKFITEEKPGWCQFIFDGANAEKDRVLCVSAAFEYLYPDVYTEEALKYEGDIFRAHGKCLAGGLVKDEWGFLPCHEIVPNKDHFWFSDAMSAAYREKTGRDLADDMFLMHLPQAGETQSNARTEVIDALNEMHFNRLNLFEEQLYTLTKELFGKNAMVATHPTWHSYPNVQEFRKNSLFWWRLPRDFAQTDETCPFPCRTGMSKREGRVWYNEYYADHIEPYIYEEWVNVAGGGRQNIHPFCCASPQPMRTKENFGLLPILESGVDAARAKTRLLSLITTSPLDSPVAVVFGHWSCMNWSRPEFGNLTGALRVCDFFAKNGYPTDLVSSYEARQKTLSGTPCWTVNERGFLQYGVQEYRLVIFYAETDSDAEDFATLEKLAAGSKTKLEKIMAHPEEAAIQERFGKYLTTKTENGENSGTETETGDSDVLSQVRKQTPWRIEAPRNAGGNWHAHPGMEAFSRRVDGTLVWTHASYENPTGMPIKLENVSVALNNTQKDGQKKVALINAKANGILACRFDAGGNLNALAGAGLTHFEVGYSDPMRIQLTEPVDIAIWQSTESDKSTENADSATPWQGVFQGIVNDLPAELKALPVTWRFLQKPAK